jgi:hypothetical protein
MAVRFTLNIRPASGGTVNTRVVVSGGEPDPLRENDSAVVRTTVRAVR